MSDQEFSSHSLLESPLSPAVLRGLGDRNYDKRKVAALEVTALIKTMHEAGDRDRITIVINLLAQEFARSRNVHHRKGGLIGLAASSIGLASDIDRYLHLLIPPVIECFDDPESRVCYYACESLYNISKVARTSVLHYFNEIFDGLCKLFAHVDVDVKNGANLLDRLIKDIVTETDTFDIEVFIPLLQKHIKRTKPYIRQLLVSWIVVLDAVPDINMLDYLPDFLDGLLNMLSDGNRDIKNAAENALADFLREIREADVVELGPMVNILNNQCRSKEKFNRLTALTWVGEFITIGGTRLLTFYSSLLGSIIYCISDVELDIRSVANRANQGLIQLVRTTEDSFELTSILNILTIELTSEHESTKTQSLNWIYMLHEKVPEDINKAIGDLLPVLLRMLRDPADEVVLMTLKVLARISLDQVQFERVLSALTQLFVDDRVLLETRGALIIRKLCALLDGRSIYVALAETLSSRPDLEFSSLMVQILNLILLTAPELTALRKGLKDCFHGGSSAEDRQVFVKLFECWSHNAVATFSLCLLAQAYQLSMCLIQRFAEIDVTVGFLMQADKLVQLLESPIFINLRLQLLEVDADYHVYLIKSLYGLLMLLPQSEAYSTLADRLKTASSLQQHMANQPHRARPAGTGADLGSTLIEGVQDEGGKRVDFNFLLNRFESTQSQHAEFRLGRLSQKRLAPVHSAAVPPEGRA